LDLKHKSVELIGSGYAIVSVIVMGSSERGNHILLMVRKLIAMEVAMIPRERMMVAEVK
jgi:hypothetical protein